MFYNPRSGRFNHSRLEKLHSLFVLEFGNCLLVSDPLLLKKARNSHIISVGGDGTFHVAINHADMDSNTFSCLAMGSGNDFITGFPKRGLEVLCFRIRENNAEAVDVIKIGDVYAHNVAGIGFEALVSKKAHQKSGPIPALKYILPVIQNLFSFKPIRVIVRADHFEYSGEVFMLSMGNGKRAGGGFKLFPKASLHDGKLDLLIIRPPSFFQKIRYVWLVNFGRHTNLKIIDYVQVQSCHIVCETTGLLDVDGDIYHRKEIYAEVIKGLLKVIQ